MKDVSVVTVTFDSEREIRGCVDSVLAQRELAVELIVVDNGSRDGTQAVLTEFSDRIRSILNVRNLGFGQAVNQAARVARGTYLFLLNPDARLPSPTALRELVGFMRAHPEVGLAGNTLVDLRGREQRSVHEQYSKQRKLRLDFSTLPGRIAWVSGASLMVPREVFDRVGGFDPDYFLYSEDADLCLRIRKAGYSIGFHSGVVTIHSGGASSRDVTSATTEYRMRKSRYVFYRKHLCGSDVEAIAQLDRRKFRRRLKLLSALQMLRPRSCSVEKRIRICRAALAVAEEELHSFRQSPSGFVSGGCLRAGNLSEERDGHS
jgi:hypothetical protein